MFWRALIITLIAISQPGFAQDTGDSPFLTLNQDRLYASSKFGQRVQASLGRVSQELAAENRRIEAALVEEERRLTDQRASMAPAAFRILSEEFDERVTSIRVAQEAKKNAIPRAIEAERARFFELAYPVLLQLVEETGAVAILNSAAIIFSVNQIDITDQAIARIDAEIGAAPLPPDQGPLPLQRPQIAPILEIAPKPQNDAN